MSGRWHRTGMLKSLSSQASSDKKRIVSSGLHGVDFSDLEIIFQSLCSSGQYGKRSYQACGCERKTQVPGESRSLSWDLLVSSHPVRPQGVILGLPGLAAT